MNEFAQRLLNLSTAAERRRWLMYSYPDPSPARFDTQRLSNVPHPPDTSLLSPRHVPRYMAIVVTLLCPVRGCRRLLARAAARVICPRGHSFDIARSGYINLLQPQHRHSRQPGDSAEALQARRRFLALGFAAPLLDAMLDLLTITRDDAVLDVGCGEGHHLAAIAQRFGCEAHGLDISVAAVDAAARRHPRLQWVVANADRFLPYADASFRLVVTVTARMNAGEFRRVLRDDGTLLVAVPAPDDLIELREAILGQRVLHDRVDRTIATFAPLFTLERHHRIRHVAHLDPVAISDVMTSSYRTLRRSQRARLASIGNLDVTLSRDVLLFRPPRPKSAPGAIVDPCGQYRPGCAEDRGNRPDGNATTHWQIG